MPRGRWSHAYCPGQTGWSAERRPLKGKDPTRQGLFVGFTSFSHQNNSFTLSFLHALPLGIRECFWSSLICSEVFPEHLSPRAGEALRNTRRCPPRATFEDTDTNHATHSIAEDVTLLWWPRAAAEVGVGLGQRRCPCRSDRAHRCRAGGEARAHGRSKALRRMRLRGPHGRATRPWESEPLSPASIVTVMSHH